MKLQWERLTQTYGAKFGGSITMIIAGHNLPQIRRLCDDVIFMNRGKIVESGPAGKVLVNSHEADTRTFTRGGLLL